MIRTYRGITPSIHPTAFVHVRCGSDSIGCRLDHLPRRAHD